MAGLFQSVFAPPRDLLLVAAAGWLGLLLADRRARQSRLGEKGFDTLVLWMLAAYIAGGRLVFLLSHIAAFAASPLSLFSLNRDAFDTLGGLASAVLIGTIILQRQRLPAWETLDLLAPLLACISIGIALSHLASGAAFGAETHVPWAINQWGALRHPTQAYELIAAATTLFITWWWRRTSPPGSRFLLWLALAAASRLVVEGFRGDSALVFGGLRVAQLIAWVVLAAALIGLDRRSGASAMKDAEPA